MARPYWSGQMRISLVSFGVQLFPATSTTSDITFHQIDRKTGQRVHHQNVIDGDRPIDDEDIVKGYEYSKGKYLTVEPEEIANLRIESRTSLEVKKFVGLDEIPPALFEKPYFVVPEPGGSEEAFAVIREALRQMKKAGIGELVFGGREHLIAIAPPPDASFRGLIAYSLRYSEEMRATEGYLPKIDPVTIQKPQLTMATELIRQYSSPLNLEEFKDDYEAALHELIEAKQKNQPLPVDEEKPRGAKVINLMDALRRSVEQKPAKSQAAKPGPAKTAMAKSAARDGATKPKKSAPAKPAKRTSKVA